MSAVTADELRAAMARYATGVTVATTVAGDGVAHAMTANSFTSVSLDPPLVALGVANTTRFLAPLLESGTWAVSVLATDQGDLAAHFSRSGRDLARQFDAVPTERGALGVPLLAGATAWVECRTTRAVPAGDHTLVLGQVVSARRAADRSAPLLFFDHRYRATNTLVEPNLP